MPIYPLSINLLMKLHTIPSCHSLNQENLALVPQQYALQIEETTLLRKKAADILDSFEEPNKAPSLNLNSMHFLDLMSGKTELDEASLTDLLTVQIMGCLGMCRKHLGESDEEWCRFQSCFALFLKAGYQGIIQK